MSESFADALVARQSLVVEGCLPYPNLNVAFELPGWLPPLKKIDYWAQRDRRQEMTLALERIAAAVG